MSGSENWRFPTDAATYLGAQKKRSELEARRPIIRRAADLVGPGIGGSAVPITDFDDTLALFDGYYSSGNLAGAVAADGRGARNGPDPEVGGAFAGYDFNPYVGTTVMDDVLGGHQRFINVVSGNIYTRNFLRNPSDPNSVTFGLWKWENEPVVIPPAPVILPREMAYAERSTSFTTTNVNLYATGAALIGGMGVTVIGEGKPVEILVELSAVYSNQLNNTVGAYILSNSQSATSPGGYVGFISTGPANEQSSLTLRRRAVLTDGVSYTFVVGMYGVRVGTVGLTVAPTYPASISVNRLG